MVDVVRHDVVIVGGGCAGLRAAIAAVEADPTLSGGAGLEGLPDAEPHRLRRGRRGGRAARRGRRQPREARLRHREGLGLPRRPGRDPVLRRGGAEGADAARALGLPVEPQRRRQRGDAPLRRHADAAHVVRDRQGRLPHAAHAVPALAALRPHRPLRRVLRHRSCWWTAASAAASRRSTCAPAPCASCSAAR